jgi:hypothetical protein
MITIHSGSNRSAIRQTAFLGDVSPLKRSRTGCGVFGRAGTAKLIRCRGGTLEVEPCGAKGRLARSAEHAKASLNIAHASCLSEGRRSNSCLPTLRGDWLRVTGRDRTTRGEVYTEPGSAPATPRRGVEGSVETADAS